MNKLAKKCKDIIKTKVFYNYLMLFIALFVSAVNYNLFTRPLKIVAGGSNGLAIVFEDLFSIPPSFFILVFSVVTLVLGYLLIEKEKASSALVATFVYPFFVSITEKITSLISLSQSDIIICSLFAGAISGWVAGVTVKVGLSQGGITLIDQILYEKLKISISKSNFVINLLIVLLGGYCFGFTSILCAVIFLYVSSVVIDKVLLGISCNKSFYIITDKEKEIKKYIIQELNSGATIFNVKSGKSDDDKCVLMATVSNELYYKATKKIKKIDKNAFFIVTDSYEVNNGHNN